MVDRRMKRKPLKWHRIWLLEPIRVILQMPHPPYPLGRCRSRSCPLAWCSSTLAEPTSCAPSIALSGWGAPLTSSYTSRRDTTRVHPAYRDKLHRLVEIAASKSGETVEFLYRVPGGDQIWLGIRAELTALDRMIGILFDITDRKAAEEEIWRTANHDALTGLPNRAFFTKRQNEALEAAEANATTVAFSSSISTNSRTSTTCWGTTPETPC